MRAITRTGLIILSVLMIFTLTAFSTADERQDGIDLEFYQYLYDDYSNDPDFIDIEIKFDEYLMLYTYTPIFSEQTDTLKIIEPGETYCRCYGHLMREIITEDGDIRHESITEEEFMDENSYFLVNDGEFIKRQYGSDGTIYEKQATIDEYLEYYQQQLSFDEFALFEKMINSNYLYNDLNDIICMGGVDNTIMGRCQPSCTNWSSWFPNPSWCFQNCRSCGLENRRIGHASSHSISINASQHQVRCSVCSWVHGTFNHNWGSWRSLNASQHIRNCVSGNTSGCHHQQTQAHSWINPSNNATVCSVCGHRR